MTCIAIDDEPKGLTVLRKHAEGIPFLDLVASFTDAFAAQAFLAEHAVDLIFLDIQMPDISGMEWLRSLPDPPLVIFTTAFPQYAAASYELDAVDYLVKPFDRERLLRAVNRVRSQLDATQALPDFLFVKDGTRQVKVRLDDILYCEAAGNYVILHTPEQKVMARQSLQSLSERLGEHHFLRVHKSYLVHLPRIDAIEHQEIRIGAARIPVSKGYRAALREATERLGL